MFKKFFTIIDIVLETIMKTMAVSGLAFGVLLAFVNVVLRYLFDMSLTWAGELTNYFFIWSALFGAAYGFKKGVHISVTLLLSAFSPIIAKIFMIIANIISVVYLVAISYFGYQLVLMLMDFEEMSIDLEIPMWIPHLVIPLAFALAAYNAVGRVYDIILQDPKDVLQNNEHEIIIEEAIQYQGEKHGNR
ncbi:MAG: TRAP transporter small permease [Epsilonproteobacteria bacterium]|nr:TRAP transporter small permease [Campylobacterota bacterium]